MSHAPAAARVRVWPLWQRLLHWGLAACVLTALWTHEGGRVHEAAGYGALGLALLRIGLGVAGPQAARFTAFVRGWRPTWVYARLWAAQREPRHLNHNPLGGWMVLALLLVVLAAGASGALYVTDRFWGEPAVIAAHAAFSWPLLGLAALHLAGVAAASWRHRENLIAAMLNGLKPLRADDSDRR